MEVLFREDVACLYAAFLSCERISFPVGADYGIIAGIVMGNDGQSLTVEWDNGDRDHYRVSLVAEGKAAEVIDRWQAVFDVVTP